MTHNIIIHGDSRETIPKIHTPINCVLTDPPFGIDVQMNSASSAEQRAVNQKIENDGDVEQAIEVFHSVMRPIVGKLADQADIYVFTAWNVLEWWIPAVKFLATMDPQIELKMMLLWDKGYPGKGDLVANWGCGYEPILYLKKGRRPNPYRRSGIIHVKAEHDLDQAIAEAEAYVALLKAIKDGSYQPTEIDTGIVHVDKVGSGQNIHPTEKPVQLLEILLGMSTDPGDFVVDPFSGSGSTSVAAQKLGRHSLAFEIDNKPPRCLVDKSQARLTEQSMFS